MRQLTNYERETIINFNEAEPTAYIFTYNKAWQRHLEKELGLKPVSKNGSGGRDYEIPKKLLPKPRKPRSPSKLTPEQRKEVADRLQKARFR